MKKYFLLLVLLLNAVISFAQNQQVLRVYDKNNEVPQSYTLSHIDSITHNCAAQTQTIHWGGEQFITPISTIDSVSIIKDQIKVVMDSEYLEGFDSYLFSNGVALCDSVDSIGGHVLLIDSLDFKTCEWDEEKSIIAYCDEEYRPICVADKYGNKYVFTYNEDNSFSVNLTTLEGETYTVSDLLLIPTEENKIIHKVNSRTYANESNLNNLSNGLSIMDLGLNAFSGNGAGMAWAMGGILLPQMFPNGLPSDFASLGLSSIGLIFERTVLGWGGLLLTAGQTVNDLKNWYLKQLIGEIAPYLTDIKKTSTNTVDIRVEFSGSGFSNETKAIPYYHINYWKELNGEQIGTVYRTSKQKAQYGFLTESISELTGGTYAFQAVVYPNSLSEIQQRLINYRSNVLHCDVAPLFLSELSQDYITYSDDVVTVSMKAVVDYMSEGDKTVLEYYDDYGLYVQKGDNSPEFYSYKDNGGLEYYITLDLAKDDFCLDYETYTATAKDIKFGIYTIDSWGIKKTYEGQTAEIIYDKKPHLTFTSVSVNGTDAQEITDDEGAYAYTYYSTKHTISYEAEGTFWFDNLNLGMPSDVSDNVGLVQIENGDGAYTRTYWYQYPSTTTTQMFLYLVGNLSSGGTFVSDNMLLYNGIPVTSISIVGNESQNASQKIQQTNFIRKSQSILKAVFSKEPMK